jgi:hypothetical protein
VANAVQCQQIHTERDKLAFGDHDPVFDWLGVSWLLSLLIQVQLLHLQVGAIFYIGFAGISRAEACESGRNDIIHQGNLLIKLGRKLQLYWRVSRGNYRVNTQSGRIEDSSLN